MSVIAAFVPKQKNKAQEKLIDNVIEWMDDNLDARYDESFFKAGGLSSKLILTFEIDFEDEADAALFFLKFK